MINPNTRESLTPVQVSEEIVSVDLIESIARNLIEREISMAEYLNTILSLIGECVTKRQNGVAIQELETMRLELYHMPAQEPLTEEQSRMVDYINLAIKRLKGEV